MIQNTRALIPPPPHSYAVFYFIKITNKNVIATTLKEIQKSPFLKKTRKNCNFSQTTHSTILHINLQYKNVYQRITFIINSHF